MKTVTWTNNTAWEEAIRVAEREEVVVMRGGHAVALLIPFDDDDMQWYARARSSLYRVARPGPPPSPRGAHDSTRRVEE